MSLWSLYRVSRNVTPCLFRENFLLGLFHSEKISVTIENLYFFFNLKQKHLETCLTIKGIRIEQQFSLYERVGGIGSFDQFLTRFSAFHGTKNVRFLCLLRFQFYFALSFWFSTKIKSGFWICYSAMRFDVFPVFLRKRRASTTSVACTSSRILLTVFGFDRNLLQFSIIFCTVWQFLTHSNALPSLPLPLVY